MQWSARVSNDEAARRAAGRRSYNAVRKLIMEMRRVDVVKLMLEGHSTTEMAAILEVSPRSIRRDVAAIYRLAGEQSACLHCKRKANEKARHSSQ